MSVKFITLNLARCDMQNFCNTCANLFESDSSSTGYRCGITYFAQAPLGRMMKRMETYPETDGMSTCDSYQKRAIQLRTNLRNTANQ